MPLMLWDNTFSVNVQEIDEQHQKLVDLINNLYDAMKKGESKDVLPQIINSLIDYTKFHFSTEEKYFDKFGYPESETHKLEHSNFVKKVLDFKQGYESEQIGLTIDVITFLQEWLTKHIKGTDKKYGPFFNEHGLK